MAAPGGLPSPPFNNSAVLEIVWKGSVRLSDVGWGKELSDKIAGQASLPVPLLKSTLTLTLSVNSLVSFSLRLQPKGFFYSVVALIRSTV